MVILSNISVYQPVQGEQNNFLQPILLELIGRSYNKSKQAA